MSVVTVSMKGQITLPIGLRRKLGIAEPHAKITIEDGGDSIIIKPAPDIFALKGFLGKALRSEEEKSRAMKAVARHARGNV